MVKQIETTALSTSLIVTPLQAGAQIQSDAQSYNMGDILCLGLVEYVGDSVNTGNTWRPRVEIGDRIAFRVHVRNKVVGDFVIIEAEDVIDHIQNEFKNDVKPSATIDASDCDKVLTACKEWYKAVSQHKNVMDTLSALSKLNRVLNEVFNSDPLNAITQRLLKREAEKQLRKDQSAEEPSFIREKEFFALEYRRFGRLVAIRSGASAQVDSLLQHCVLGNFYLAMGNGVEDPQARTFCYDREVSEYEVEIINNIRVSAGMKPLSKNSMGTKYWPAVYLNKDTGCSAYMSIMTPQDLQFVSQHFSNKANSPSCTENGTSAAQTEQINHPYKISLQGASSSRIETHWSWALPLDDILNKEDIGPIIFTHGKDGRRHVSVYLDHDHTIETEDFHDGFNICGSDCNVDELEFVTKILNSFQYKYGQTINPIAMFVSCGKRSARPMVIMHIKDDAWPTNDILKKALKF